MDYHLIYKTLMPCTKIHYLSKGEELYVEINSTFKVVYLYMLETVTYLRQKYNFALIPYEKVSANCGVSVSNVRRNIKVMLDVGILFSEKPDGYNKPVRYTKCINILESDVFRLDNKKLRDYIASQKGGYATRSSKEWYNYHMNKKLEKLTGRYRRI